MRSTMQHLFSQVPRADIQRSRFDRSHGFKTTFNAGFLIPILVDEALPGDTFNVNVTTFARLNTPLHPIMDNMYCDVFFFAVPYRLVWNHFVNFFGEQDNPTDTTSYLVPTCTAPAGGYLNSSLQDHMGIPPGKVLTHANLHQRAYNLIWNQWFRDQNMQNSVVVDKGDGPDNPANYTLLRRGKRHDYFTSALPFPQKGPSVNVPIGTSATVKTQATARPDITFPASPMLLNQSTGGLPAGNHLGVAAGGTLGYDNAAFTAIQTALPVNLYADLSTATAATINQLRQAFQIQRLYERDARGGTRYTELIQSHFNVTSPDARLQRPEYLGGGSAPVNVNPIAQTAGTGASGTTTPQGNLAAMGTMSHRGIGFVKSFTEHCLILGLMAVRADLNYQQGLNRMWSRSTRFDFYWPAFSHIGEQAILNQEIYANGDANDTLVFGYQERYAEYRYKPSIIAGQFRSSYAQTLDSWHLAQNFATLPALNSTFIQDNPPIDRIVAVTNFPHFLFDAHFNMICARPMPVYGVPGMIDHF